MNDMKDENIKGALDYAIVMIHFVAKQRGIELTDSWGVWGRISEIEKLPSVKPQQKMGKWIFHKPFDNGHKNCNECIECNQCHTLFGYDCYAKTLYCPNCGAKMKGVE